MYTYKIKIKKKIEKTFTHLTRLPCGSKLGGNRRGYQCRDIATSAF